MDHVRGVCTMQGALQGKHALVTGAAQGLGRAVAEVLAREGCRVVATDVATAELSSLRDEWPSLEVQRLDVTDPAAIDAVLRGRDRLDILVNCAGIILRDGQELTPQGFERVIDVNLHGTMRMCYGCRPLLAAADGCIVNIASMLSFFGSGFVPAYSASKGGIAQLTRSLAIAWAAEGIRVNAIAPGWIKTGLTAALYDDPDRRAAIVRRTPLERWGTPEDICGAAVFLCSPAAAFITGVILPVDGGYSVA